MVEYRDFLQQRGHRCEAIWSIRNIDYVMDERQKNILEAIVSTEEIPNDIDILIINRSSETSINIRSKLTHIFVAMDSCDIITQVRGRYRDDLQNLHIITQNADLVVPNDYLGRPLFGEDTDELCRVLNVKRDNGALAKWRTIKELLPNYGYSVTALPRKANRHSYLICKDR